MAHFKHSAATSQRPQTAFACSAWATAAPLLPSGKNSSGSSPTHAGRLLDVSFVGFWFIRVTSGEGATMTTRTTAELALIIRLAGSPSIVSCGRDAVVMRS